MISEGLLNVKAVAKKLNMGVSTVYRMAEDNELPHVRIRRRVLFDETLINEWLTSKHKLPTDPKATTD